MKTLTDRGIRALKPRPHKSKPGQFVPYRVSDTHTPGLHIQVTKTGRWNWTYRYRFGGRDRFLKLGSYPATSIADARLRANDVLGQIEAGIDPAEALRQLPPSCPTVACLLEDYLENREKVGVKSIKFMRGAFKKNVLPYIGNKLTNQVMADDVTKLLRRIVDREAITVARRVQQFLHAAFAFGWKAKNDPNLPPSQIDYGLTFNPVSGTQTVKIQDKAQDHYPTLAELAIAWNNIDSRAGPEVSSAFRFHIAMGGQRVTETVFAEWDWIQEVNGAMCLCIPTTKVGNPHTVPIGSHAQQILDEIKPYTGRCQVIFPQRHATRTPIKYTSISNAIRKLRGELNMTAWTPKQVRRTAKTVMSDNGMELHKLDYWQNHNQRATASQRHYLRATYLNDKLEVMALWDQLLGDALADYKREQLRAVA